MAERRGLTGVVERGTYTGASSGTWEILSFPREDRGITGCRAIRNPGREGPRAADKRFAKYGLTVHPDKTRLVSFRRPPRDGGGSGPGRTDKPGTINLLGFTHYWGRSRRGNWVIKQRTMSSRLSRSLRAVWTWCKANRHRPLADQHRRLARKLRGHYAYYGVTGNGPQICAFRHWAYVIWRSWLNRRSRHTRGGLAGLDRSLARYPLPNAVVVHSVYRT